MMKHTWNIKHLLFLATLILIGCGLPNDFALQNGKFCIQQKNGNQKCSKMGEDALTFISVHDSQLSLDHLPISQLANEGLSKVPSHLVSKWKIFIKALNKAGILTTFNSKSYSFNWVGGAIQMSNEEDYPTHTIPLTGNSTVIACEIEGSGISIFKIDPVESCIDCFQENAMGCPSGQTLEFESPDGAIRALYCADDFERVDSITIHHIDPAIIKFLKSLLDKIRSRTFQNSGPQQSDFIIQFPKSLDQHI